MVSNRGIICHVICNTSKFKYHQKYLKLKQVCKMGWVDLIYSHEKHYFEHWLILKDKKSLNLGDFTDFF